MENLTIVILNYNSYQNTSHCAKKILSFNKKIRIIIVDNNSSDGSFEILVNEFGHDKYVDVIRASNNGGYSAGNNIGCNYAISKYNPKFLGIVNPDVIIPKSNVIEHMISVLKVNEKCAIVGTSVVNSDNTYTPGVSAWKIPNAKEVVTNHFIKRKLHLNTYKMVSKNVVQVDCVLGAFFLVDTQKFISLGMFDEHVYLYNEENILGIKCKQKGYQVLWCVNDYYIHNHDYNHHRPMLDDIKIMNIGYRSRKYLITKYYKGHYTKIAILSMINLLNILWIIGGSIKRSFK